MNQDLVSEQQNEILKELKLFEVEPCYKALTETYIPMIEEVAWHKNHDKLKQGIINDLHYDQEHEEVRSKLLRYRLKSEQIYQIGELLKEYQHKFHSINIEKQILLELIFKLKGETSELVNHQKKMLDLSLAIKEALDYYSYHDKFKFDFPCEISCREMFQDLLQPTLSEIIDGIIFFQENSQYYHAKKYLNMFQSSRSKVSSFVKSFLIKLFNRESNFVEKNAKIPLQGYIESFYPKSKIKFISEYLTYFPEFQKHLKYIILHIKEGSPALEINNLEMKQIQIEDFQLSESNLSLIGYLERNMKEVYNEGVLKFFSFYRQNVHQNLIKKYQIKKEGKYVDSLKQKYMFMMYIISTQLSYLNYCCRITLTENKEFIKIIVTKLSQFYAEDISKLMKDQRNKYPFEVCEKISEVSLEYSTFLQKHFLEEYQSYAFGCVSSYLKRQEDIQFLKDIFTAISNKHLSELESLCLNYLPQIAVTQDKGITEENVKMLISYIPKLKYCENHAERYMVSTLEVIIKSIREINKLIDSRFQCYIWNIVIFNAIKDALKDVKISLIKKELKIDTNNSANIISRVRHVENSQSFIKYAQDIFQVIKNGMPIINELTLDFTKYVSEHLNSLENIFVKDIFFVYAKNMIEFLQKLTDVPVDSEAGKQICQKQIVQSLYLSYTLSIEKYLAETLNILKYKYNLKEVQQSNTLIYSLLDEVYQRLFDLLDRFYIVVSQHVDYTQEFQEISYLKQKYQKTWHLQ